MNSDIKSLTLEEAKHQLKMNLSILEMLKENTPLDALASIREDWVEPLERLIAELTKGQEDGNR
jgi:hypothetical protein